MRLGSESGSASIITCSKSQCQAHTVQCSVAPAGCITLNDGKVTFAMYTHSLNEDRTPDLRLIFIAFDTQRKTLFQTAYTAVSLSRSCRRKRNVNDTVTGWNINNNPALGLSRLKLMSTLFSDTWVGGDRWDT